MTKLQFRVLYREFLFRMVDPEVLSAHAQGDAGKLLGQFALLIFLSCCSPYPRSVSEMAACRCSIGSCFATARSIFSSPRRCS
jgi:hypothetical protein